MKILEYTVLKLILCIVLVDQEIAAHDLIQPLLFVPKWHY